MLCYVMLCYVIVIIYHLYLDILILSEQICKFADLQYVDILSKHLI